VPQYRHQSVLLDLSTRAYVFQYLHVNVTETPIIPYDPDRYYIFGSNTARVSVVGDVVGPIFPTMPVNATSLLNLPMDSAEQTMSSFAANLYTTMYMRLINQRNRTIERDSFHFMNILYQRVLSFLKPDGSFSIFRSDWNQSDSSVWLTAYCARIFQDASFYEWENFIYIDPAVISNAVHWILKHQTIDGGFYEVTWSPDRKANTSLNWPHDIVAQRNISLTAHVLITLETIKDLKDIKGVRCIRLRRNFHIHDSIFSNSGTQLEGRTSERSRHPLAPEEYEAFRRIRRTLRYRHRFVRVASEQSVQRRRSFQDSR
jgi:CD109 antigen